MSPAKVEPPANEEVPVVVTSKAPEIFTPVAEMVVTLNAGIVEVAADDELIFPEVRRSPERLRDDPLSPVPEIGPANVEVPVVSERKAPEILMLVTARFVERRAGMEDVPVFPTSIVSSKIAVPPSTRSPWVRMRSVAEMPPVKEVVPAPEMVRVGTVMVPVAMISPVLM